jgi:hypothetical protein
MINRLPKEYAVTDVTGVARKAATAPASTARPPLRDRLFAAAADSVGTHPVASLGLAFVTGIILGKLVKR